MKCTFLSLLAIFAVATAHAGSFGGPPYSNGSPLVTGVDGSYQATARNTNVTGVFRFQYSGGSQTGQASKNNWIFFVAGQIQRGTVVSNIDGSSVNGVLDSLSGTAGTNTNGTLTLPIIQLNANGASMGDFSGKMSANGNFSGSGQLLPSAGQTNQVVWITTNALGTIVTGSTFVTNSPGTAPVTSFKFTGVRTSTTASTN